jgi:hypothetical protein
MGYRPECPSIALPRLAHARRGMIRPKNTTNLLSYLLAKENG